MIRSNYIVYDCETGGLDPEKNPITQFAFEVLDFKTLKTVDKFSAFVKPYNDLVIDKVALDKTHVTMAQINKQGVDIKELINNLADNWKQHNASKTKPHKGRLVPVGQNIVFDNGMLEYAFNYCKKDLYDYVYENFIDTQTLGKLTWGLLGDEKLNLTALCNKAGIDIIDAHGAPDDTEATADLFRFFMKRLRSNKSVASAESVSRKKGEEFFEFKCNK